MTDIAEGRDIAVGIDPAGGWRLPLAWAADEAHRRNVRLRLVLAVPSPHDTERIVDDTAQHNAVRQASSEALAEAAAWARERHPGTELATALRDGYPAPVLCGTSRHARMVVLGSRHLTRPEEIFSGCSVVLPVTAQAHCPVVVVRGPERTAQTPAHIVVGVDGGESSKTAMALAFQEAALHGCELHAISVWQPPVFSFQNETAAVGAQRRMLTEVAAGGAQEYPDAKLTHEVLTGHPVERLAEAAEHALALIVGRRGKGGYTGLRLGSVVHGLLHRAHCPVITVPSG
ncbi:MULTISPECIES: universal stress protein [unclassified Streptomyces]|uniref:universal stress protein n=1 Tax=unclassified Streptomyces TaxID=2593676 RepID=UPI000DC79546|nr:MULTISPECIES: universal stress protein [unclassified Streptomyces]AWZ03416.1 universal stress protein [Streptomyces sp. ICC4]AWZ11311.1 universal stress protein [Streptomyces sp. ICC1]